MIKASWPNLTPNSLVLDSREAILDLAPLLEALAERCGQAGAMHWLPYFLDKAVLGHRVPYLVLLLRPEDHPDASLSVDDIEAAALFFEYRLFGLRTGAVATGDAVGFSSVIAPHGQRTRVAATAARALTAHGASIVLATFEGADEPEARSCVAGWPGVLFATRERHVGRSLHLRATLEDTLAQMGKKTRTNLRYYRRQLEAGPGCTFLPDATAALQSADLEAINQASLNPIPNDEFQRRVHSASHLPGSFLCGLRGPGGEWLSLAGGWRQGKTTVLHWQMNTAGFERQSICTVMRSYLIENEIARGAEHLLCWGGTSHSMRSAFRPEPVADLIVRRRTLRASLLLRAARLFASPSNVIGRENFLASTLHDASLKWVSSTSLEGTRNPALLKGQRSQRSHTAA